MEMVQPLRPHVLPAGQTHLRLYGVFAFPVVPDLFSSSLLSLELCPLAMEPLRPGVLPLGLRDLTIGSFSQPLLVGSLPQGLEFLRVEDSDYVHPLLRGVIPDCLIALDLPWRLHSWPGRRCPRE
jgi:hypothetical protein